MTPLTDHPRRQALANELHARPFPVIAAPASAVFLALKPAQDAASRDRDLDRAHLIALLDHFGASHPQPGATHYFGTLGRHTLKWESHTEFVSYTLYGPSLSERPFDGATFEVFPQDWLEAAPGERITSALVRIETLEDAETVPQKLDQWFVPESLAASWVLDEAAIIAGDFRIDAAGHMRFAVFVAPETGARRVGRVVQRVCEIETYKSMSMLGFDRARDLQRRMVPLDQKLSGAVREMTGEATAPAETLQRLLSSAAELEQMSAQASFRLSATRAYAALVTSRIEMLREARFQGRQTFAEFMVRRFDPAMRTVEATETQLSTLAGRAMRAAELLRTRVDVERSAQNQALLESMDRRADLQLRLQKTVEGLSVVAISYYAVNLAVYMAGPLGAEAGLSKTTLTGLVTPVVIGLVWWTIRRIRRAVE